MDDLRDVNQEYVDYRTFGQMAADVVAKVAGSLSFIITFLLVLSMLAAVQAPIIMMTQNRQSARDRLDAEIDHGVNLRAEMAIQDVVNRIEALETKLDYLTSNLTKP